MYLFCACYVKFPDKLCIIPQQFYIDVNKKCISVFGHPSLTGTVLLYIQRASCFIFFLLNFDILPVIIVFVVGSFSN